ncbi:MAG TPA: hypothetical protein PK677_16380, partial [Acidiphilium sp.]|nr:hypothetical protein [Acidiphilium sp.]
VHLHDPCLWSLVVAAYPGNDMENIMRTSYPEISLPDGLIGINEALDRGALGSRKLLNQQDLRGIIVNSGAARRLVERELPNVPIRTIFHPIFKKLYAGPQPAVRKPGSLRIGSFGVPHAEKCTDLVLAAFFEIRLIRPDAELILAGYGAPEYIRSHNIGYEQGVFASEPEETDTLVETMATCDVAIQLRRRNLGESSGIMALLMSVGIPVIGFDIGAFQDYRDAVRLIPRSSTIKEISAAIIEEVQNSSAHKSAMADIIEARSPLRFCTAFKDAIADLARPDRN